MNFIRSFKGLCAPAMLYFVISMLALLLVVFQNLGNSSSYTVGSFSCRVPHTGMIFAIKFVYIMFWTYILNLICRDGHSGLSWLLVMLPWVLLFVIMGLIMMNK